MSWREFVLFALVAVAIPVSLPVIERTRRLLRQSGDLAKSMFEGAVAYSIPVAWCVGVTAILGPAFGSVDTRPPDVLVLLSFGHCGAFISVLLHNWFPLGKSDIDPYMIRSDTFRPFVLLTLMVGAAAFSTAAVLTH